MAEPATSNREIENIAIQLVLEREHAAGMSAVDARGGHALVDIEGDQLIEVKAYSGSARGSDLWLEPRQVQAALDHPDGSTSSSWTASASTPRLLDI